MSEQNKTPEYQLLACNCDHTIKLDAKSLKADLGLSGTPKIYNSLCRSQLGAFEQAIATNDTVPILVTCTQEAPLFHELAAEAGNENLSFVNIRETAGWSKSAANPQAKTAALIAGAAFSPTPTGLVSLFSNGACLVYGKGQQALDVAIKLSAHLSVSLVLTNGADVVVPATTRFPICRGKIIKAAGVMGKFKLRIDGYAFAAPSSMDKLNFTGANDGIEIVTDLIFDLSGEGPIFSVRHGRDGYVRVDPQNPLQIGEAMLDVSHLVGEFEKPIYVAYDPLLCAHSRSDQVGCSNCIDACPSSAISSSGEGIVVRPAVCDGCGHCSSSCPTGAISYAYPNRADLIQRCQIMMSIYHAAGGSNAVLLIHEEEHGANLISALARYGDGLADNVLPMGVPSIAHLGHESLCALFTCGVQSLVLLAPLKRRDELDILQTQVDLANAFLQGMGFDKVMRVQLLVQDNPDGLDGALKAISRIDIPVLKRFTASANKRETAYLAFSNLNAAAAQKQIRIELPEGSPYGIIEIDQEKCTLCLSCVSACPANALADNEDKPQLLFTERACVQCGLCKTICPENAILLACRYNFDNSALSRVTLHEEEPLACSVCGKPFGSRSAIEKVIGILEGNNPMFQNSAQVALLRMCEDCRVITMAETDNSPMAMGTVPRVLTADDVLPEDDEPITR